MSYFDDVDTSFIRNRITELRMKKGVSEYRMSLDMGHNKGYIQRISSGKSVPSLPEFLYICDYLDVTPKEFFDTETNEPAQVHFLLEQTRNMDADDLDMLILIAKWINSKKGP